MAKLPGYDAKANLTTEAASVKRDVEVAQAFGKGVELAGQTASQLAKMWQEAKDFEETLDRQNFLNEKIRALEYNAERDPEWKNSVMYDRQLAEIKQEALTGFSNNLARNKFALEVENKGMQSQIKLDSIFREKLLKTTQGKLIESHEFYKNEFIKTGNPEAMATQQKFVNMAFDQGIVDGVFVANEFVKINEWRNLRFLQMAREGNIEDALRMIDDSDMQPSEKNAAKASIMTMAEQNAIVAQINQINNEQKMYAEADNVIDDPNMSFVDKLSFLEQQRKFGMPEPDYKQLLGALTSQHAVAAESHAAAKVEIALAIKRLNKGMTDDAAKKKKNVIDYLKQLKATRELITQKQAEGVITKDDKVRFINDLNEITAEERNIAAARMGKEKLAWWFHDYIYYGYDDAYKDFQDQLEIKSIADDALLDLYYEDQDSKNGKMTSKERKAKVSEIVDKYNEKMAAEIKNALLAETGLKPQPQESEANLMKRLNVTEQDIQDTMAAEGWTREYTINYLRGK